jgi:hypothetical protein
MNSKEEIPSVAGRVMHNGCCDLAVPKPHDIWHQIERRCYNACTMIVAKSFNIACLAGCRPDGECCVILAS